MERSIWGLLCSVYAFLKSSKSSMCTSLARACQPKCLSACSGHSISVICAYLFYFWLHWVFVAARGLFSSCGERGATLRCSARASHCGGFSCCGAQALSSQASVVAARGLSSCGSQALERSLNSCGTRA